MINKLINNYNKINNIFYNIRDLVIRRELIMEN